MDGAKTVNVLERTEKRGMRIFFRKVSGVSRIAITLPALLLLFACGSDAGESEIKARFLAMSDSRHSPS